MFKKSMCSALLTVMCCLPVFTNAAECRSGQAAQAGSTAGYAQAKKANDAWADLERKASEQLQSCLARLQSTKSSTTSFTSLEDVLTQLANEVCQAAITKVRSMSANGADPWQQY
jgi:TraL protein